MAGDRPRIQWRELDGTSGEEWWTQGWLPDSDGLRWSLAAALKVEAGFLPGAAHRQADYLSIRESYVAENEDGEWLESGYSGEAATIVTLEKVDE
jgi:hypothetical protein